jgi:phosphatidylglycerophosphate synthase
MGGRTSALTAARRDIARAHAADGLTVARGLLAAALAGVLVFDHVAVASWMLTAAWITDALDGRLARASTQATRLGHLDLAVDTSVGAGLLLGMAASGHVSWVLAAGLLVALGGGFLVSKNAALAMVLQAVAYAWFLVTLWQVHPLLRWLPLAVIVGLLIAEYRRLTTVAIPTFLSEVASLVRGHHDRADRLSGP